MIKKLYFLELRYLLRKRYPIAIFAAVSVYLYFYHFIQYHMFHARELETAIDTQEIAFIVYIAIAILSLDMFSDQHPRHYRELLNTTRRGGKTVILVRLLLLVAVVVLFFLQTICIDLIFVCPFYEMPLFVTKNIFQVLCLNYLIVPFVGVFLGMFCGTCFRRWHGILLFMIIVLLGTGLFQKWNNMLYMAYQGKINLDGLSRVLTLIQPDSDWILDPLYLIPAESYRYFVYCGWIFVFAGGILLFYLVGKKKLVSLVPMLLCICCFWQGVDAGSISNLNSNADNVAMDVNTFQNEKTISVPANFRIEDYQINLSIGKELRGEVSVRVDQEQNQYRFTLYRGYKIVQISDSYGNPLNYSRDRDYVTVETDGKTRELRFVYKGSSGTFYNNRSAMMLPGFFAWYPQAGFRPVFENEIVNTIQSYGYNQDIEAMQTADFQIALNGMSVGVYSNLKEKGEGFAGRAKTATLVGGPISEEQQSAFRLLRPTLTTIPDDYLSRYLKRLRENEDYLQLPHQKQAGQIFFVPEVFAMADKKGNGTFYLDDHILTTSAYDPEGLARDAVYRRVSTSGLADVLWNCVLDQMDGYETDTTLSREEYLNWKPESAVPDWPVEYMYATLRKQWGEEKVNPYVMQWLQDDAGQDDCIMFLKDLYLKLEGEQE